MMSQAVAWHSGILAADLLLHFCAASWEVES